MHSRTIDDNERAAIVAALNAGESQHSVAARFNRGKATIGRIVHAEGIQTVRAVTKRATEARRDYDAAARLELLNRGFERAESMLEEIEKPSQLQLWAIGIGILIDKRRLEDGDVTSRTEIHDSNARERLASRIDELAARRATQRDVSGTDG